MFGTDVVVAQQRSLAQTLGEYLLGVRGEQDVRGRRLLIATEGKQLVVESTDADTQRLQWLCRYPVIFVDQPNRMCSVPTYSQLRVRAAPVARMRTRRALSVNLSNIATPIAFVLPSAVDASRTLRLCATRSSWAAEITAVRRGDFHRVRTDSTT